MAASNQNIFGYIPTESVDWSKAIGGLYTTVRDIETTREDLKLELDQLKTDNIRTIQEADNFTSQTFQQQMLGASQNGVATIKAWNDALKRGELDPKEYKQRMNNLMENWGTLATSVKGFDTKNAEIQKKLQSGEISKASVQAGEYFARMGDLKNLQVFIDPSTGGVSTGRLDAKTGQVIPDTIESSKTIADINNMIFDKVKVDESVAEVTKYWQKYTTENGITVVTDLRQAPGYAEKIADLTGALTSNNRSTLSILMDNMDEGFNTYYTAQDKDQLLMEMVDKQNEIRAFKNMADMDQGELNEFIKEAEKKLIPMQKDASGVYQPMITAYQRDRAKEAIKNAIELQIEFKSIEEDVRPLKGDKEPENKLIPLADKVVKNFTSSEKLSEMSTTYDFKWIEGGKLQVYKTVKKARGTGFTKELVETIPNATVNSLTPYLGVTNLQQGDWDAALNQARAGGRTASTTTKKPKPATPKNNDPLGLGL